MQYSAMSFLFVNFKKAVILHNISGVILLCNYILFVIGNGVTKNGKYYTFSLKTMSGEIKKQYKYYSAGMFRGKKSPFPLTKGRKFNPLQKVTYFLIMYILFPVSIMTGIAMLFPEIIISKIFNINGVLIVDMFHISVGFLISVFLIVHIYFVTIGFKKNIKAIVTGWAEED
jgi:thiosulfate reductase cytochrome b subunit